jgi:exopolysaccharide biosynthesis protein
MSYAELSQEMIRLGCREALNLDGGGSTAMVIRDPRSKEQRVINEPSDGRERAVACVLGVTAK